MSEQPRFQQAVGSFVVEHGLEAPVATRALDLVSEVGEVAKEVLKGTDYGRRDFQSPADWSDELADCFFSLACLANSTGVNLESALARALEKYRQRLSQKGDAGSGR